MGIGIRGGEVDRDGDVRNIGGGDDMEGDRDDGDGDRDRDVGR